MFKNLTEMQKKLVTIMFICVGLLILLFGILGIINLINGGKLSFDKIEKKMVDAAESYYKSNKDLLPSDDFAKTELDVNTLVEKGLMKSLNKYTKENVSCTGKVVVVKNGEYYNFIPKLDCGGDYKSKNLVDKLTSESNIVTSGDGLYKINDEYVYRGENINNYVTFAGLKWRILKLTKDGEIRMILDEPLDGVVWDDRYNPEKKTTLGINLFEYEKKSSRIKETLEEIYNGNTFSASDKAMIIPKRLCVGKRSINDESKDGSTECSVLTEQYLPLGLLQVNEFLMASLDKGCTSLSKRECMNYNYLATGDTNYWTLTANKENSYEVYYIDTIPQLANARKLSKIKLVINITGEVNYDKGIGSLEEPYIIK